VCFEFLYKFCLKHFSFKEEMSEICSKMCIGLHVKYPLFLSDFNKTLIFLERVCSQTQLCQLRCFNDYTWQLHVSAPTGLTDTVVFDYIHFPVFTHTTGMTHFQFNILYRLSKNTPISNFTRIHSEGAELFHVNKREDRWTDRHVKANSCFSQFCKCT